MNKFQLLFIIAIVIILVIIIFLPIKTVNHDEPQIKTSVEVEVVITAKEFLGQEITDQGLTNRDFEIMHDIIFCESSWSQFYQDGSVKVSNGNVGLAQINIGAHQKEYTELGLDPFNEFDNIRYAIILYKRNGTRDWEQWSGHCFIPRLEKKGITL